MTTSSFASLFRTEEKKEGEFQLRVLIIDTDQGETHFGKFPKSFFLYSITQHLDLRSSNHPSLIFGDCQDDLLDLDFEQESLDVSDDQLCFVGDYEKKDVLVDFGNDIKLKGTMRVTINVQPMERELEVTFYHGLGHNLEGHGITFEDFCRLKVDFSPEIQL